MGGSGPSKNGEEKTWKPSVRGSMGPLLTTPLLAQVALTNKREELDEGLARGSDDSDDQTTLTLCMQRYLNNRKLTLGNLMCHKRAGKQQNLFIFHFRFLLAEGANSFYY